MRVEEFTTEHMEKLLRGMNLAAQSYKALSVRLADADARNRALFDEMIALREALANAVTREAWEALITAILDTERGVLSVRDLYDYAAHVKGT